MKLLFLAFVFILLMESIYHVESVGSSLFKSKSKRARPDLTNHSNEQLVALKSKSQDDAKNHFDKWKDNHNKAETAKDPFSRIYFKKKANKHSAVAAKNDNLNSAVTGEQYRRENGRPLHDYGSSARDPLDTF